MSNCDSLAESIYSQGDSEDEQVSSSSSNSSNSSSRTISTAIKRKFQKVPTRRSERDKSRVETNVVPTATKFRTMKASVEEIKAFDARENRPQIEIVKMKKHRENDVCRICQKGGTMLENFSMLRCDGCDMPVHKGCYDVETTPQRAWLCRGCTNQRPEVSSSENIISGTGGLFVCDPHDDHDVYNANFAYCCTFFHRFGVGGLKLSSIKIEELAHALKFPNESSYMGDLFIRLLSKFESRFKNTWEIQLSKALDKWNSNGVVFEGEKNSANPLKETEFADLLLQSRILLLLLVCDWLFEKNRTLGTYLCKIIDEEKEDETLWRDTALGSDHTGRDYWLMEDTQSFWISRCQKYDGTGWELVCKNMDDLDQLITSCGESTYAAELQLWVALNDQIKPYFTRKVTRRDLAAKKLITANKRLGMCGVDWTNIKINDNNENEDSTRRSRRSRKAVSYTNHHDYEDEIDDPAPSSGGEISPKAIPQPKVVSKYDPSRYRSRSDRMQIRTNEIDVASDSSEPIDICSPSPPDTEMPIS